MNNRNKWAGVLLLFFAIAAGGVSFAAASANKPERLPASAPVPAKTAHHKVPPGVEAAQTLSLVTGVAISPLLGVGSVGAYRWWNAPAESRGKLPWYARPWFWIPALALVACVGLKDLFGTAAPAALKKPFDVAEAIENKVSALVVAGAFIPLIISIFPEAAGNGALVSPSGLGFAAIPVGALGNALLVPLALAVFGIVWLASHAVNMLILLSPFTTVDAALKLLRMALLALVAGTAFINPYLGAVVALAVIVFCYFIAGWSFRLAVFGTMYVWDYVTFRRCRFQPGAERNAMFTARKLSDIPVRTYGKLSVSHDGRLSFSYRPLLVLKARTLEIPAEGCFVGRGLFCPEIDRRSADKVTSLFILPPRYLTHEETLSRVYRLEGVQDVGVLKGMKAAWKWLKNFSKPTPALTTTPAVAATSN